jgi:hypothetical protein
MERERERARARGENACACCELAWSSRSTVNAEKVAFVDRLVVKTPDRGEKRKNWDNKNRELSVTKAIFNHG